MGRFKKWLEEGKIIRAVLDKTWVSNYAKSLPDYSTTKEVIIIKNPTLTQAKNFCNRSEFHSVRACMDSKEDLYIWDAGAGPHWEIVPHLKIRKVRFDTDVSYDCVDIPYLLSMKYNDFPRGYLG